MRIAVMGAGSTGGYFGGMLARGGNDVALIARGAHLEAIRTTGLKVVRDEEEFLVHCQATDDPSQVGPVDLALLCVKTYQSAEAVPLMKPLVGPGTTVLCLQNGVDSYQMAAAGLGHSAVLPGAAFIEAGMLGPGAVRQTGSLVRIILGETNGVESERCRAIRDVFLAAGVPSDVVADIKAGLWGKFLFISTMAGITSMARATLAELMPQPNWRRVVLGCLAEIDAVGRAGGVNLPKDIVADTVSYIEEHLADLQASMHTDLVAGRPLELEALNGAVVRSGNVAGVPTPINDVIYAMLKALENGA
ncbi:MAG: 2-dehydropantoate 2-reductase [SAR202 cluster bacterium Io17-Chloro-G6]|nr:MAG: 2-dehydropantoate 2-reductase [SAR202 cluster bacterium Io17-Chloro-G6]